MNDGYTAREIALATPLENPDSVTAEEFQAAQAAEAPPEEVSEVPAFPPNELTAALPDEQ